MVTLPATYISSIGIPAFTEPQAHVYRFLILQVEYPLNPRMHLLGYFLNLRVEYSRIFYFYCLPHRQVEYMLVWLSAFK